MLDAHVCGIAGIRDLESGQNACTLVLWLAKAFCRVSRQYMAYNSNWASLAFSSTGSMRAEFQSRHLQSYLCLL